MQKNIQFGVDYYPEHWDKNRWRTDLSMMQEMGIDLVRFAEFSWSLLEPRNGEFDFSWLDEVIGLSEEYGLKVVLGTPTAAPPAWIINQHPEIQPKDRNGLQKYFGGRHHACHSNKNYRYYIERYVEKFASHFGGHPNVIGWQVDNELGNSHGHLCFCDSCQEAFQVWLEQKYQTIDQLNDNWGTAFWSQSYQNFQQIQAPKTTASGDNPSQMLDWKKFHSDLINEFHAFQAKIIRKHSPGRFITHNLMGFSDVVNYFDLGEQLEFVSHDQYPGGHFHGDQARFKGDVSAAELDFVRSVKKKSFWIMEQQTSITGWEVLGRAPKPGEISLWSVQSVAHGADAIVYFRWRTSPMGTEQYWHGILPHSGVPGRSYNEIKALIQKVKPLMKEINGTLPKAKVGIVFSYAQGHAITIQPHHPELRYVDHLLTYYKDLYRRNIMVDFVQETDDFSQYDVLIAPLQYLMSRELENKYKDYVKNGGQLVMTMRTGVKETNNISMIDQPLPGNLSEVLGVEVHEYDCLRDVNVKINWDQQEYTATKWADIITLISAKSLATYGSEFYEGSPAITYNQFGKGSAYYVGTELTPKLVRRFFDSIDTIQDETIETESGVEISYRENDQSRYYFVLNHTDDQQKINLPVDWVSYFVDQDRHLIKPRSFQIYQFTKK